MKHISRNIRILLIIAFVTSWMAKSSFSQTDSTNQKKADTTVVKESSREEKKQKGWNDEFLVYAGVNLNYLRVSSGVYKSEPALGYHFGAAYKRGKFFYWQVGARFSNATFSLKKDSIANDTSDYRKLSVRSIDVPITGGINFLSAINRVVALRLFISVVPSFALGVGSNDLGITKSNVNGFVLYGQGGLGVNVAFLMLEAGYNYGFQDLFKNSVKSAPGQLFINLGFRF